MLRLSRSGLGAALAVVLAAPAARAAEVDKLIPADADTVVYVNVRQIIDSEIIKKFALEQMRQTLQGNEAQKFLKELGLDPLKDIDKVIIGASGKDQNDMKALVIVRGKFDPDRLYKAAEAQTRKDADRFSLIKDGADVMFKYQPDDGNPVYGTVVNDTTVVVGTDRKLVSAALAAATADKRPAVSRDLATLVGRMDDKASFWAVAIVKGKLDNLRIPGAAGNQDIQGQIGKMDNVTLVVRVTKDVALDVTLGMADDAAADELGKTIEDGLQQIKGLLPFLAANEPRMKPLVEVGRSLKSTTKGRSITISARMAGDAIAQMLGGD
jgi:hypothetical protein